MEPETRATSFEKDAHKTKDNAPKTKTRNRRGLDFKDLDQDFPDEYYEILFNDLYTEIFSLVHSAFLPGGKPAVTQTSPWLREYPEEFLRYVELVAHPNTRAGQWDLLLRDGNERVNLLTAIIFRVLDRKVFSSLLFGAGGMHDETLEKSDTALIIAEGFQRSSLRSHTTRTWLRTSTSNGEPPRFWEEVDELCNRMVAMLLPIYAYANDITSSKSTHSLKLYQSLHDVIAYAGWLSVLVRLSPAIVSIDWTAPGDRYSMGQANSCHDAYVNSKVAIIRQDMDSGEFEARSRQVMSAARVKISVTPKIVRHKPVPKTVAARGVTSYTIMKPHVVYYQGYRLEKEEKQAFISLPDYIKQLRDRNCVPLNIATLL
ncbi:hypothetical protein ACLX1H_002828 [Fusarium chlamydosporum]